jgi:hypothetical protein
LAESLVIYEIVKGETIPAIVIIASSRMFLLRGHFHSGYSNIGDNRKSCMSAERYQLCPKHCNITRFRVLHVLRFKSFGKLRRVEWYRSTGVSDGRKDFVFRGEQSKNILRCNDPKSLSLQIC